jgi:hypothetical protein
MESHWVRKTCKDICIYICIVYACTCVLFIYRLKIQLPVSGSFVSMCLMCLAFHWVTLHHHLLPSICTIRAGVVLVSAAIYLHSKFPYKEAKLKNDDDARRDDDRSSSSSSSSTGSSSIHTRNSNHNSNSGGRSTRAPAVSAAPPSSSASGLTKKND